MPAGTDRISANMIWPDPTNDNTLYYILTDPQGQLAQISYDYRGAGHTRPIGGVPNIQHTEVSDPTPGKWTATILWGNGRAHLQEPPNVPGTYTGNMSFEVSGENYVTSKLGGGTVKIPAESLGTVDRRRAAGDRSGRRRQHVGAVVGQQRRDRVGAGPGADADPADRRTVLGDDGNDCRPQFTADLAFFVNVPAGHQSMSVSFNTPTPAPTTVHV